MTASPPVLTIPGLWNSGPAHWQTHWEAINPSFKRVQQQDWETPQCVDWITELDKAIIDAGPNVVLAAHSAGCHLVAQWSALYPHRRVKGALLVAPPAHMPPGPSGFLPTPSRTLSFPSIVVASRNDEYATIEEARQFAAVWGSRFVDIGMVGHINSDSNLKDWPAGFALLNELRAHTTP